jgi:hypothetical protein
VIALRADVGIQLLDKLLAAHAQVGAKCEYGGLHHLRQVFDCSR